MSLLRKTKTYLLGSMEYGADNRSWREYVTEELKKIGVVCFDPYNHPFVRQIDEGQQVKLQQLRDSGDLDDLEERMKDIRRYDLSAVDRSDFIICMIDPETPTYGTIDELVMAESLNRPIFMCVKGGKRKAPLWLYSLVSHKYMYDNIEDVVDVIRLIDQGVVEMNSKRWKLMKPEYR